MITLLTISFIICIGYAIAVQLLYKVASISESYYYLEQKKKGIGKLFLAWTVITAFTLLPVWLEVSDDSYQFIAFLSVASLMAVGCVPDYQLEHRWQHPMFTAFTAILAMAWGFLAGLWYIPIACILVAAIYIGAKIWQNKWLKNGLIQALVQAKSLYFIEIGAFAGMYLAILIKNLM